MTQFLRLTINGLANGAILALTALGFVLIYKATEVINFAQGQFLVVGAFLVYNANVTWGWPWPWPWPSASPAASCSASQSSGSSSAGSSVSRPCR